MALFSQNSDSLYELKGSQKWAKDTQANRNSQIRGFFQENQESGMVSSIEFGVDDEAIFYEEGGMVRSLELCLTVMEEGFYLKEHERMYELKLKRKNLMTILFTSDYETFVKFYVHLAKYCILTTFQKHFRIGSILGIGTFGKVYNAQNIFSKEEVALKIFEKCKIKQIQDGQLIVKNQIINMEKLRKYHLSPLIAIYETNDCIILVMQKAEAGNMIDYIKMQKGKYNGDLVKMMMKKILVNLKELHSAGFIHRDIKPENILFSSTSLKSSLFLGDFGLTVQKNQYDKNIIAKKCSGTMGFIAPQVIHDNKYDEKCDIFSLGCLFYFLHKGQCLFHEQNTQEIMAMTCNFKYIQRKIEKLENLNQQSEKLMIQLLSINPKERPSAEEALKHQYFENMDTYKVWTGEEDRTLRQYLGSRVQKFYN